MKIFFLIVALGFCKWLFCQTEKKQDTLISKTNTDVMVTANRLSVKVLPDKMVIAITDLKAAVSQNALDLLRTSPGIMVDGNEHIQMGGKDKVQILIDGRNMQLSDDDAAQLLKSIDAENIKEIELISNPSAIYDASGKAGIINIKLKKSIVNGFNGTAGIKYQQSVHNRKTLTGSFNARKDKLNFFGNISIQGNEQNTIANTERYTTDKDYLQKSIENDQYHSFLVRTGADYYINKKNTLGFLYSGTATTSDMFDDNVTLLTKQNQADTMVFTKSIAPTKLSRNNYNLNYSYQNTNETFIADANYTTYSSGLNNTVAITTTDAFQKDINNNSFQNNASVMIDIITLKADYRKKMNAHFVTEYGIKTTATNTKNNLDVLQWQQQNWISDTNQTNRFNFTEKVTATYTNITEAIGKLTFIAGLRFEYSNVKGVSTDLKNNTTNKPDTAYANLFPSLFIQYQLNPKTQIGFSYGKRIDRPTYQDQNPFVYTLDAFNREVGNPYLLPQITNNVELQYTYNYSTNIKASYSHTQQYIEQLTYQDGKNTVLIPQNAGYKQMINLSISTGFNVKKWWNFYVYAEPFWQQYHTIIKGFQLNTTSINESVGFNGYLSNTFSLNNDFKIELSGWFNYQNTTTIYTAKPIGSLNINTSKAVLKNKLVISTGIKDIFNTQKWQQTAVNTNLNMHTYRKWESRNIYVGITYKFGNNKIKDARERNNGNEAEENRIKSK
jgi:outer membrane receptor protein involved in Fe transport